MNNFLKLTESQKRSVFNAIAHKVGLPAQVVEKDFWVTAVLQTLFSLPISRYLVFKGGTSLSKGWKLIERFSEDVDLAIDPSVFGVSDGDLTKKQIKKLRKASSLFVLEELTPTLTNELSSLGMGSFISCEAQPNGLATTHIPNLVRSIFITSLYLSTPSTTYVRILSSR